MSTAYSSAKQQYIGNGVTTEWGFDFPIKKHSELKVYLKRSGLTQVLLEEGVDYSFVTENTIAFPIKTGEAKLQAADVLALQRESVFESEYNFSNQQRLEPEEVMHADDNLERQIQELKRDVTQAIRIQPTSNINTDEYFIAVESIYENLDNITNVSEHSSEIITCSNNIEAIQDAPNQANAASQSASDASQSATNAANSATASANSATASANSANNSHIWAEGTDAQVQALGGVHSSKVWAEQSTNANISLTNSPYTTNRILEIPQDIKLELNNGTLTLKAGSKVYVPNGFEADGTTPKFDVVIVQSDLLYTEPSANVITSPIFYDANKNSLIMRGINPESGSSVPSGFNSVFYNTSTNLCYNYRSGAQDDKLSFPIGVCTSNGQPTNNISSIDQVFNGFGYIGSHFFVLPGVKVQIPDERNEDSSYKTFSVKTNSVTTASFPYTAKGGMNWYIDNLGNAAYYGLKYIKFSENNLWESTDGNGCILKGVVVATSDVTSGVISNYKSCIVDSVANSNASNFSQAGRSYLSGLGMPSGRYIDLTFGASGSSYTAPANGWFSWYCNQNNNGYIFVQSSASLLPNRVSNSSNDIAGFIPVKKGDIVYVEYNSLTFNRLRFIYVEGEN